MNDVEDEFLGAKIGAKFPPPTRRQGSVRTHLSLTPCLIHRGSCSLRSRFCGRLGAIQRRYNKRRPLARQSYEGLQVTACGRELNLPFGLLPNDICRK